jgi:tight adherence protein B
MLAFVTAAVFFLATFLAALIAVAIAWMVLERRSAQMREAQSVFSPGSEGAALLKDESLSTVALLSTALSQFDFAQLLKTHLQQSGLSWSVGRLVSMMLLCGATGLAVAVNVAWVPWWFGVVATAVAGQAPYLYVRRRRRHRLALFEEQFPEALDFLARALRAGHPFAVGLEMLANESPQPLAGEIRKTHEERQFGQTWEQALANLNERVPLMDVSFFAAAVELQSRTGGKLGEVLARLAETMRERFTLRGEIRAISAHGRLTGLVLTLLPLLVGGVMAVVNPAYLGILLTNPWGTHLLLAAGLCLVVAHLVIRRMVNIKF